MQFVMNNMITSIEELFSEQRAGNNDWIDQYTGAVTDKSSRAMTAGACQAGSFTTEMTWLCSVE